MFNIDSPMPPIWMMYPHITQYSIGWRMGYGEGYKYNLFDWLETLSEDDRISYRSMYPQPIFWTDLSMFDNDDEDNGFEEEVNREILVNGVLIQYWTDDGNPKYSKDLYADKLLSQSSLLFYDSKKSYLGRSYLSPFTVDIDRYCCLEHYIIAQKALMFDNKEIYKKIVDSANLDEIREIEKTIDNIDLAVWNKYKNTIILTGNYYKFTQNKELRDKLFSTENVLLINDQSNASDIDLSNLQNRDGFALMEVRDELKRMYKHYNAIDWSKLDKYTLE